MDKQENKTTEQEGKKEDKQVPEQEGQGAEKQVSQADIQMNQEPLAGEKTAPEKEGEHKARKTGKHAAGKTKDEIKKLENSLKEIQDKYLRLSAEFDNYRKRTLKEKIEWSRNAGEEIFTKILPVIDDMERALVHIREASDLEALKQGTELIYNKFREFLSQQGVSEINAMNQEFNTDQHEAVTKIPAPDPALKGKIVDVIEKGYMLNEKVIRFPKVVIGE